MCISLLVVKLYFVQMLLLSLLCHILLGCCRRAPPGPSPWEAGRWADGKIQRQLIYIYIYIYIYTSNHMCMYIYIYIYTSDMYYNTINKLGKHAHQQMCNNNDNNKHVCVYMCVYTYVYIYIHTHTYVLLFLLCILFMLLCIYIYIYIYTQSSYLASNIIISLVISLCLLIQPQFIQACC